MARLVLFHRRIDLASDDVYLPAIYILLLHCIWISCFGYVFHVIQQECSFHSILKSYILSHILLMALAIPLEIITMVLSMSGTLANKQPRQYVSPLCHVHVFVVLIEMLIQCIGFYAVYGPVRLEFQCHGNQHVIHLIYTVLYWSVLALFLWIVILGLFLWASKKKGRYTNFHKYHELWKRRLDIIFGNIKLKLTNGKDVMADVAGELADYFKDIDWAPSDLVAGLILVKRRQKQEREEVHERKRLAASMKASPSPSHSIPPSPGKDKPAALVTFPQDYSPAVAAATMSGIEKSHSPSRPTYHVEFPSLNIPKTATDTRPSFDLNMADSATRSSGMQSHPVFTKPDPESDKASEILCKEDIPDILHFAKYTEMIYSDTEPKELIPSQDMVHFSDDNDLFKLPYMIVLDHEWESIVIAIRGTYSAADVLVDLNLDLAILDIPELPDAPVQWAHSGMLRSSQNILSDILSKHLLSHVRDPDTPFAHYRVVVTGHSLGAGVGQLLTYALRQQGFADARCYAYEPPGMLLTYEAAAYFDQFVLSTVFGDDLVPRSSRNSLEFLKLDVRRLLSTCHEPKYKVLGSALSNFLWKKGRTLRPRFGFKTSKSMAVASEEKHMEKIDIPDIEPEDQRVVMMPSPPLFIPGRILYIEKLRLWNDGEDGDLSWVQQHSRRASRTGPSPLFFLRHPFISLQRHPAKRQVEPTLSHHMHAATRNDVPMTILPKVQGKYAYCPRWANREEFLSVIVSSSMISDHWPIPILKEMGLRPLGEELKIPVESSY